MNQSSLGTDGKMMSELTDYLFEYSWQGSWYSLTVPAASLDEAKGRVARMSTARYSGTLEATIPAIGAGWLVRLLHWWRNS